MPQDNLKEEFDFLKQQFLDLENRFNKDNFSNRLVIRKELEHKGAKLSFYSKEVTTQPTDIGIATVSTVTGSGADATINSNFSTLRDKINDMRSRQQDLGLMK